MNKHDCTPPSSYLCDTVTACEHSAHPKDKLYHESEETGPVDHPSNQDSTDGNTNFFMKNPPYEQKKVGLAEREDNDTE